MCRPAAGWGTITRPVRSRDLHLMLALLCAGLGLVVAAVPSDGLLMLLPALLLLAPLVAGRYLGEDAIERVRVARTARRPRAVLCAPLPRPVEHLLPRGGLLLGSSLARRPPPALA